MVYKSITKIDSWRYFGLALSLREIFGYNDIAALFAMTSIYVLQKTGDVITTSPFNCWNFGSAIFFDEKMWIIWSIHILTNTTFDK